MSNINELLQLSRDEVSYWEDSRKVRGASRARNKLREIKNNIDILEGLLIERAKIDIAMEVDREYATPHYRGMHSVSGVRSHRLTKERGLTRRRDFVAEYYDDNEGVWLFHGTFDDIDSARASLMAADYWQMRIIKRPKGESSAVIVAEWEQEG